jgi:hypothetical protein
MNQDRPLAKGEPKDRDLDRDSLTGGTSAGMADKATTKAIDPTAEDTYWRDNYGSRPYIDATYGYDDYGPAYRYAADSYGNYRGRSFDEVEGDLESGWDRAKGKSRLAWEHAKAAVRDAWDRLAHGGRHDSDRYVG